MLNFRNSLLRREHGLSAAVKTFLNFWANIMWRQPRFWASMASISCSKVQGFQSGMCIPKTFQGLHLFSGSLSWSICFWVICLSNKFKVLRKLRLHFKSTVLKGGFSSDFGRYFQFDDQILVPSSKRCTKSLSNRTKLKISSKIKPPLKKRFSLSTGSFNQIWHK